MVIFFEIISLNFLREIQRTKSTGAVIYGEAIKPSMRFLMAAFILVFAFQRRELGFICWYAGIYYALGAANQSESFLVNKYTPNNMRASILSLSSLMTQVGGLCGSLFSSIAIIALQFSGIWTVAAGLSGAYAIAAAAVIYKIGKKNSADPGIIAPHDP
jgi:predicted MFS family arabinose efflux permease